MTLNILNSIPVVGHTKAVGHYVLGDEHGGNQAMYEATRTTGVWAGGSLGVAGGPVGMALGGVAGGLVVDTCTSLLTGESHGMIAVIDNACTDIANGKIPTESLLEGGFIIASDALSGQAGSTVKNIFKAASTSGKSVASEILKAAIKSKSKDVIMYGVLCNGTVGRHFRVKQHRKTMLRNYSNRSIPDSDSTSSESEDDCETSAAGSGGEPPRYNRWNDKREHEIEELEPEPSMTKFLAFFDEKSLDDIRCLNGEAQYYYPFRGLARKEKQTLKKLIKNLDSAGYLYVVLEIVMSILFDLEPDDVTFITFISVSQFVGTFVGEKVSEWYDMEYFDCYYIRQSNTPIAYDMVTLQRKCSATWEDLLKEITNFHCEPYFRDDFCAAYHYYKHRRISWMNIELSVEEYFDLIESMLEKLKITEQYAELGFAKTTAIHMEYYGNYNGTVKIVVKIQQNRIVLSSFYISIGYLLPPEDIEFGD